MPVYDADLPNHPKLRQLERSTGRSHAVLYLLRLWAHCATKARSENLGQMTPEALEEICRWDGQPGELYRALKEPYHGRPGWITVRKSRTRIYIRVHDWQKYHTRIVASWNNGKRSSGTQNSSSASKAGTSKNPMGTPRATRGSPKAPPMGTPRATRGASGTGTGTGTGTKSECETSYARTAPARTAPAREADPGSHSPPAAGSGGVPDASDYTVGETRDPVVAHPELIKLAREILDELNRQLGAEFPVNSVTLHPIVHRLLEIRSSVDDPVGEIKKMVRREVVLHKGDSNRSRWLQPKTLFDERQFPNCFGARNLPVRSIKKNAAGLREAIDKNPANKESIYFRTDHTREDKQQLKQLRAQLREIEQTDQQP